MGGMKLASAPMQLPGSATADVICPIKEAAGWLRATEVQILKMETVHHSQETHLHPLLPGLELLEGSFPGVTIPVPLHGT